MIMAMNKNFLALASAIIWAAAGNAASPVHDRVIEYAPAPGQFVNIMPEWEEGDDANAMANKAHAATSEGGISLGAYGGYVVVGFDHTVVNVAGERDLYIEGNMHSGGSEPGVVMVAYDINGNGLPDENEWFEIRGSEYDNSILDYECTYYRPENDDDDIRWTDNQGGEGYVRRNAAHQQPYWPQWLTDSKTLVFRGTRLPDNGIDQSGNGTYFVLSPFDYGYADNVPNIDGGSWNEGAKIDIDWAVDAKGNEVKMPGVDFVKIYTGVNQYNGWIGENSTEVCRVADAHVTREGSSPVLDETVAIDQSVLDAFLAKYGGSAAVPGIDGGNGNLRVYLDRATGCVNFDAPAAGVAQVFNQSGMMLYSGTFSPGKNTIELCSYPAGLYLVRIDGKTTKILKL